MIKLSFSEDKVRERLDEMGYRHEDLENSEIEDPIDFMKGTSWNLKYIMNRYPDVKANDGDVISADFMTEEEFDNWVYTSVNNIYYGTYLFTQK